MARTETYIAHWQGFMPSGTSGAGPALGEIPDYVRVVNLAFGSLFRGNMVCTSYLQKSNTFDAINAGIRELQSRGVKVLLSILPANAARCGWDDVTNPNELAEFIYETFLADEDNWHLDGIDIDGEPVPQTVTPFVEFVNAMRSLMGDRYLITYEAYSERDLGPLRYLTKKIDWINLMNYTPAGSFDSQIRVFNTYADLFGTERVAIGVAAPVTVCDPTSQQGTPLDDVIRLCQWDPPRGRKKGVMLYSISNDVRTCTGQPDLKWTETINQYLP